MSEKWKRVAVTPIFTKPSRIPGEAALPGLRVSTKEGAPEPQTGRGTEDTPRMAAGG